MPLRILHLSDIHMTEHGFEQDLVLTTLASTIDKLGRIEAFDLIIITGDIAYSGKKAEYDLAEAFIDKILQKAKCAQRHVFVVPGNHDVDRSRINQQELTFFYSFTDEPKLNEILSYEPARENILRKLSDYHDFSKRFLPSGLAVGPYGEYATRCRIVKGATEYTLGIIGLNSAFFSSAKHEEDKGKLAIGIPQVTFCTGRLEEETDYIISMVHHPFSAIHECDETSLNVLKRVSDIIAFGHRHKPNNEVVNNGKYSPYLSIGAGASFETRLSANYFNVIELDENTQKGSVTGYMYVPSDHIWVVDSTTNKNYVDNKLPFDISKPIAAVQSASEPSIAASLHGLRIEIEGDSSLLSRSFLKELRTVIERHCKTGQTKIERINAGSIIILVSSTLKPEVADLPSILKGAFPSVEFRAISQVDCDPTNEMSLGDPGLARFLLSFTKEHENYLNDAGTTFSHPRVDGLVRDDLFVTPTLLHVDTESKGKDPLRKYFQATTIIEKVLSESSSRQVVYGPSACGKTTLAKWIAQQLYDSGFIPIVVAGEDLTRIDQIGIGKIIDRNFQRQYDTSHSYSRFDSDHTVLLVDDMQSVRIQKGKYRASLVKNIEKLFPHTILLGNELLQFGTYISKDEGARNMFDDYDKFVIAELGPVGRYQLVARWNALGRSEIFAPNEMVRLNKETEEHVEQVIGKNYVPSYPMFVLSVLQIREASQPTVTEQSQHGFYYEKLINDALNRAVTNREDLSLYYNYITDYAYHLFNEKIGLAAITLDSFNRFFLYYVDEYDVDFSERRILDTLVKAGLLEVVDDYVKIRYRYVYYFFVAKYMAGHMGQPETKFRVTAMCERLHREEFANVIMFLTHLTKDSFITDELMRVSRSLWSDVPIIRLDDDVRFMNDLIKELPASSLRQIDAEQAKRESLEEDEQIKRYEEQFDEDLDVKDYDISEDIATLDAVSQITRSLKTIDILGQIAKKYWGALKADRKYDLIEEVYFLGLRTLGFYFKLIGDSPEILLEYIKKRMRGRGRYSADKDEIDALSRNYLFSLGAMCSYYMVKRVTQAVGHDKLKNVFEEILAKNDINSVLLIDISNKLELSSHLPYEEVRSAKEQVEKNFMALSVLQGLAKNYLYMFNTTVEEKQRLASLLNLKMEYQRKIDRVSQVKRHGLPPRMES